MEKKCDIYPSESNCSSPSTVSQYVPSNLPPPLETPELVRPINDNLNGISFNQKTRRKIINRENNSYYPPSQIPSKSSNFI